MDEELRIQFDELGVEPTAAVIAKGLDLCVSYHIDAAELVEQWMAYSISNLKGAEPTVDYFNDFERKVFQARRDKELAASNKKKLKYSSGLSNLNQLTTATAPSIPLGVYGVEETDIMGDYMSEIGVGGNKNTESDIYHTPKVSVSILPVFYFIFI
ncbi:DNA polymerase alpha subunit B-like [Teleopsis dalmanni]|uniref:DNA polymerase alpha subunit B-like n=1 Tax=Teleopsis dalmanni TaxID=139649 RepID=UPI0018CD4B56|nr:DNA polymerase alpha subunit B-like [Teleopsis dalmanni]